MLCPVCLGFDVQRPAVATVAGTDLCAQHATEAVAAAFPTVVVSAPDVPQGPGNRPRQPPVFTAPT